MFTAKDVLFNIPQNDVSTLHLKGKGEKGWLVICVTEDLGQTELTMLNNMIKAVNIQN